MEEFGRFAVGSLVTPCSIVLGVRRTKITSFLVVEMDLSNYGILVKLDNR